MNKPLLVVNAVLLGIGNCGGPLAMRLYFLNGGNRIWLSSALETGGWPLIFIPLIIAYFYRRPKKFFQTKPFLFASAAVVGILTGIVDYLYANGMDRLPVSTSSLIIATQLAFTAGFAYLLVKQKFTPYSINAVVLLTVGAVVLAMHTSADRPNNESDKQYITGFVMTLGASALYGFVLPLVELSYMKSKQEISYVVVMEFQMVVGLFASIFCVGGMLINNDFKVIPREAQEFALGETRYYIVLVVCAVLWQCFFLGAVGVIFCSSSLLSGVIIAVLLPVTEVLAIIFYKEKFQPEKGIALALSLWGFVSYFYGEFKASKEKENPPENGYLVETV